jgi:hypothetical protein
MRRDGEGIIISFPVNGWTQLTFYARYIERLMVRCRPGESV